MQVRLKQMISWAGAFVHFSSLAFLITSETSQFNRKILDMVVLKILNLTITVSNSYLVLLESTINYLHLFGFSWRLLFADHCSTAVTALCIALRLPLRTISARVVSSTYRYLIRVVLRSFIIRIKSQGHSLVPWGTPDGTGPHSPKSVTWKFDSLRPVQENVAHPPGNSARYVQ